MSILRFTSKLAHSFLKQGTVLRASLETRRLCASLNLSPDNVLGSPFADIPVPKTYLHEFVWEKLERWPDKIAMECAITGRAYTYHQLRKLSGKLAMSLRKGKVLPGDTIAVVLPNVPEYAIITLASSEAGLCATLINPVYTSHEMEKQLTNSEAVAIFTNAAIYPTVKKSIEKNRRIRLPIIVVNDGTGPVPSDAIKLEDMMRDDIEEFSKSEKTGVDYNDPVLLPYSSGTTGLPKGVLLTHKNLAINLQQISTKDVFTGQEATGYYQEILALILPMYHIYGLNICTFKHLRIGGKQVTLPQFSTSEFLKLLYNHRVTFLYAVPPIIQMLAYNEEIKPRHIESLKYVMSGAAPLGEESIARFHNRIASKVVITQGYGMTESTTVICLSKDAEPHSVGYPLSNTQLRFVGYNEDNSGKNLGPNEVGEIYMLGPQIMKGYFKNPEATRNTMDGEWLKTGDVGYYTKEGLVYIQGRIKELIKVKGYQVPPAELEEVIRGIDEVQDVAVIGMPHEKFGEIPKAFVVAKQGTKISEEDVKKFVAERVAKFKQLGEVKFVDKIPKTASGKILRSEVRKM